MKITESAGGVVVNQEGEVLLVRNGPGAPWWGFPKGHVDQGEDLLAAARREIYEESSLKDVTMIRPLGAYERYKGQPGGGDDKSELKTIHMFLFQSPKIPVRPIDPGNPEARWVSLDEVKETLTHSKDKEFFSSIRNDIHAI